MNLSKYRRRRPRKFHAWDSVIAIALITTLLSILVLGVDHVYARYQLADVLSNQLAEKDVQIERVKQEKEVVIKSKDEEISKLRKQYEELIKSPITAVQRAFLETKLLPLSRKHGIPDALIAGQWAIESGRAIDKPGHNYFGLMQWDKQGRRSLQYCPSLDKCVENYANTIKSILSRKGYTYNPNENPLEILKKLQEGTPRYEGDSSNQFEYVQLISQTEEFKYYSK